MYPILDMTSANGAQRLERSSDNWAIADHDEWLLSYYPGVKRQKHMWKPDGTAARNMIYVWCMCHIYFSLQEGNGQFLWNLWRFNVFWTLLDVLFQISLFCQRNIPSGNCLTAMKAMAHLVQWFTWFSIVKGWFARRYITSAQIIARTNEATRWVSQI